MQDISQKMEKVLSHLQEELKKIRTGQANPAIVENISVQVYGVSLLLKECATISIPEPRQILIHPFDQANLSAIKKAIEKSQSHLNPFLDGDALRISIPSPTEEDRKRFVKFAKAKGEEAKVQIRRIRQEENKRLKREEIPEDEKSALEKKVDSSTHQYCEQIDTLIAAKEREILSF